MMRRVRFTYKDGSIFDLPLEWLLESYADYKADRDVRAGISEDYDSALSYRHRMKSSVDEENLMDYLICNIEYQDIKEHLIVVSRGHGDSDYSDFEQAAFGIIETPG